MAQPEKLANRPDSDGLTRLLVMPALWAGHYFTTCVVLELVPEPRNIAWLDYVTLLMLALFVGAAIWAVWSLKGQRGVALLVCALNLPFALSTAFMAGMAASGTSL